MVKAPATFLVGLAAHPIDSSVALTGLLLVPKVVDGAAWPNGSYKYTELVGLPSAAAVIAVSPWKFLILYTARFVVSGLFGERVRVRPPGRPIYMSVVAQSLSLVRLQVWRTAPPAK